MIDYAAELDEALHTQRGPGGGRPLEEDGSPVSSCRAPPTVSATSRSPRLIVCLYVCHVLSFRKRSALVKSRAYTIINFVVAEASNVVAAKRARMPASSIDVNAVAIPAAAARSSSSSPSPPPPLAAAPTSPCRAATLVGSGTPRRLPALRRPRPQRREVTFSADRYAHAATVQRRLASPSQRRDGPRRRCASLRGCATVNHWTAPRRQHGLRLGSAGDAAARCDAAPRRAPSPRPPS